MEINFFFLFLKINQIKVSVNNLSIPPKILNIYAPNPSVYENITNQSGLLEKFKKKKICDNLNGTKGLKMGNREKFLKIYSNLPINIRKEVILVLEDKGPITWEVAYLEVENKTKLGDMILKKLFELKII